MNSAEPLILGVRASHAAPENTKTHFKGGGCRVPSLGIGLNLICPEAIRELGKIYQEGEKKYPFENPAAVGSTWLRGLPWGDTINHLQNHLLIACMGGDSEGDPIVHLSKVMWGCSALIHFLKRCKHHHNAAMLEAAVKEGWDGNYGRVENIETPSSRKRR